MKQFYTFLAAVLFTATTFAQVGINTETADPSAALDIVSTTGGLLVPRMTETQRDDINPAAIGLMIYQTDGTAGFYYYNGSSWEGYYSKNEVDTLIANLQTQITNNAIRVGDIYGGGVVFYLLGPSDTGYVEGETHGLIAAEQDQSDANTGIQWIIGGDTQTTTNGNTSVLIGKGQANTEAMMSQANYTGGAATVCYDYSTTVNGITYNDWFLPSRDELDLMWTNLADSDSSGSNSGVGDSGNLGDFANSYYWSSTEADYGIACIQSFTIGLQYNFIKNYSGNVRAVRAF